MKNGKRPTLRQKLLMKQNRMDPDMWLVVKETQESMHLVHRWSDRTTRIINKRKQEETL